MEIQVKVPTSLNEIPLKHYVDFLNVQKGSNDEEFIAQKMIEIFCGIRLADVAKIKLTSLNEMVLHFTNLPKSTHIVSNSQICKPYSQIVYLFVFIHMVLIPTHP